MTLTMYEDSRNNLYRVSDGLTSGKHWMTVRIGMNGLGSMHQVTSPALLLRENRVEAQRDLDAYAKTHDLRPAGSSGEIEE